jgi:hypothetical protein
MDSKIRVKLTLLASLILVPHLPARNRLPAQKSSGNDSSTQSQQNEAKSPPPVLPRGKKLILKDGSFQLVREFEIQGDRVRYYSIDSSDWEEIPESLVDWDATKKEELRESQRADAAIAQEKKKEQLQGATPLDIDASIEAAPGVFLPPGAGPFAFDGKAIFAMMQADMNSTVDKRKAVERVLVPIPIIPSRHTVSIAGTRAKLRIRYAQPEFYMRTSDGTQPDIEIVRAKVHGYVREIEKVDEILGQQAATGDTLSTQRWVIAPGVFRFTLGKPLDSGEYAIVEVSKEGGAMSLYIWDFGVDGSVKPSVTKVE